MVAIFAIAREGSVLGRSMSALGQKQTYAAQRAMSALPPIATAKADFPQKSCLLYPQERTCAVHYLMSAKGQKRTYASQKAMSALPQIATAKADFGKPSCLLYPQ